MALSSSAWNWRASPPAVKKLLGSWPSGRETMRAATPVAGEFVPDAGRLLPAAVAVGIKGEIDGSWARRIVGGTDAH